MKKFGIAVLGIFAAVLLAGCNSGLNGDQSVEYGSLTMNLASDSRYLDVSEIKKATVNVWYNKSEKVSKTDVSVSAGKGSVTIENIPAGSNRVVEVIGYKATGVEGKRLYHVTNITGGNTTSISSIKDGKDSAKGKAYLALLNAGVSVSGVSLDGFDAEKSAYYFDADSFAQAYKSDESVSPSSYYTAAKTVTLSSIVNAAGYTVWIGDPLSEKLSITSNSTTTDTIENVAPGTWTIYANNGSNVKSVGTVTVAGSNVSFDKTIGSPYDGHVVVYVSAASAPRLWIWQASGSYTDGKDVLGCEWNDRPTMSAADGMYDNDGWYMYDLTANGCTYTDGIAFNFILDSGSNIESGKTATFWYDAKGLCGTEKKFYDSDPTEGKLSSDATLASISVNGTSLTGFASGTTNYSTSVATTVTSATVTAVANYSAATVVVSPSGSTDLTEGVAKAFTITVTAEDGTTTKTYTVNVTRATANDTTLSSITVNGKSATISGTTATANITGSEDSLSITSIVANAVDSSATITYSA
ncbi:MAG: cadherin-like beta sandwich domain-containing protein, partial [Treponema sp.]|nr:cadherin-like beta sandwich domain-containing protein [Treponema sp.]